MSGILNTLTDTYGGTFSKSLLSSFENIQQNFATEQWKVCGLEAGHFVEYSRRVIEFELFNAPIDIGHPLNKFHDSVLKQYEQAQGNESYRILIPRILFSIRSSS
ncbi:MAG TPA: hypothetical protein VK588_14115, partial [Chitinophagaceae bacterium]|nr:hypothetical protein [Chitinophagaceae bacterium]